ncbi:MAG: 4-hydroxyphenylacetate 3-hydroxylase N-terminal domain-containing protein [Dongiaceae bacterium]
MTVALAEAKSQTDFLVSKTVSRSKEDPNIRSGAQFVESLRDGRTVIANGREIPDVTAEPWLRRGIDTLAGYFDAQRDPATRDILTTVDPESGERISTCWLVPKTIEDLRRYDRMIKYSTYQSFGVFGRPVDYGPVKAISFVAWNHLIEKKEPEAIDKIRNFLKVGQRNNLTSADIIIDVQANRKLPMPQRAGRLRVVEERRDGIVVSGAKAGNSVLAQGNIGTISMPPPDPTMPEECMIWGAVPANAPGMRLILREPSITGRETSEDHPLDSGGEEADGILLFDRVFLPWEYVFSYRNPAIRDIYTTLGQFAFWKIANRLSYRAEIFVGAAQMIVSALGTDHIPAVRAQVAEVIAYASAVRGLMTAAIEKGQLTESGVMLPHPTFVTAGRLHAIQELPQIMQILRDLSGQGLIGRVPQSSWDRSDIGPLLDEYLPGNNMSARDKNRLFNLVWDMTCSPNAMRLALFENINATPAPALKEELFRSHDRSEGVAAIRRRAGIE